MSIVTEPTVKALYELIRQCFYNNRKLDRMVSILSTKFSMNQTSNLIHHGIAHWFPALSDKIGEQTLERYNISVIYGETPSGAEDYDRASDIISEVERRVIDFQTMFMGVCKIALENNDIHVYADLLDMLEDVNEVVEQVILLRDKMEAYGEDRISAYDHDVPDFWILKEAN